MAHRAVRTIIFFVAISLGLHAAARAADSPLLGSWKIDLAKSTFIGNPPADRTMTFEKVKDGIKHTVRTVGGGAGGEERYTLAYTFNIDGKEYKPDVSMPLDSVSFRQIDANTVERDGKDRGNIVDRVVFKVSPDGKTLTVTETRQGATGVEVYEREK